MKWRLLTEAAEVYRTDKGYRRGHAFYDLYFAERNDDAWWSDGGLLDPEVKLLFGLLKHWNAGVQTDKPAIRRLRSAATKVQPVLKGLRGKSLVDIELDPRETADISKAFALFSSALRPTRRGKYSWTAPSKVLHTYNTRLFVMWDSAIRAGYGIGRPRADSYARDFMPRMQREAVEAIDTFAADQHVARRRASAALEQQCGGRPLARLIDQYNILHHRDGRL